MRAWLTSRAGIAAVMVLAVAGCARSSQRSASCTFSSPSGAEFVVGSANGSVGISQPRDGGSTELASMGEQTAQRGALVVNGGDLATVIVLGPSAMTHLHITSHPDLETRACEGTELSVAAFSVPVGADVTVRGFDDRERQLFELSSVISAGSSNVIAQIGTPPPTSPG